jgi:DNA-binding CsgD family transcriptional regulator
VSTIDELAQGRAACRGLAWHDAYQLLSRADRESSLGVEDLELLATAAYLTGRELEFCGFLERAHHAHLEAGDRARATRCAFWLGLTLVFRGETGQGNAWLTRAQRLVEDHDCAERGYVLLPVAERYLAEGNVDSATRTAAAAAEIGCRFADADLIACARHIQGRALIRARQLQAGLAFLDEAMLATIAGELSPIMAGLVYCSVIEACQEVYASSRAREWTDALARWCDQQPQMVAFTGTCLVHRAEIMQLHGDWSDSMAEASRACERFSQGAGRTPPALALYQQAELYRLRGEFAAAEEAYRNTSRLGCEPQPGLSLLRLAQGRIDAAGAAIRRVVGTDTDPLRRAKLLPAHVEIALAAGEIEEAHSACRELEAIAENFPTDVLKAIAAQARGTVELTRGDARAALGSLRQAFEVWRQVEAPYDAARVRVLVGLACRSLGDEEAADLELDAARSVFDELGAAPELARLSSLATPPRPESPQLLTPRELEVLRSIAAGKTNKSIAAELFVSERTIDRHVSNILTKLEVSSRAAATAYAYAHKLF